MLFLPCSLEADPDAFALSERLEGHKPVVKAEGEPIVVPLHPDESYVLAECLQIVQHILSRLTGRFEALDPFLFCATARQFSFLGLRT